MGQSRRAVVVGSVLAAALAAVAVQPVHGQAKDPCDKCKPKQVQWSWKANGYALGVTTDEAKATAKKQATDSACKTCDKYLGPQKVPCRAGCNDGEVKTTCEASKKSGCSAGTYEDDKGMWKFVCRKAAQVAKEKIACDKDEAAKRPAWSMCDVSVKSVKQRECIHPDCADKPEDKPGEGGGGTSN